MNKFLSICLLAAAVFLADTKTLSAQSRILKSTPKTILTPSKKALETLAPAALVSYFADRLEAKLKNQAVGYAFVIAYEDGKYTETRVGGGAQRIWRCAKCSKDLKPSGQ